MVAVAWKRPEPGTWAPLHHASLTDMVLLPRRARVGLWVRAPDGATWRRFGFSVGQPWQEPPRHPAHRDDPGLYPVDGVGAYDRDGLYQSWVRLGDARLDVRYHVVGSDCRVRLDVSGQTAWGAGLWWEQAEGGVGEPRDVHGLAPGAAGTWALEGASGWMTVGVPEPVSRSWDGTMRWGTERSVHAAVLWNLCQDGDGRLYLPVSRAWVEMIHRMHFPHAVSAGPVIFGWDTALAAVAAVELGVDLVEAVLAPMFEHQRADGMIPQVVVGTLASRRTGPPVVFHALARLHERLLEPRLQRRWYANLVAYYRWLRQNRCQGDSGLYQWGGEEGDDHPLAVPGRVGAALESGMDDSPMWDEVEWDADRRCLAVDCVGFSSLMARAAEVMSLWSADLGFPEDAQAYHGDYLDLVDRINGRLWDEEARIYRNRRWDGWFTPALTPTSFFPLLAGAAPPDRARDLLTHLFNPRGFWGDHVIPSLIPTHHAFDGDGDYWRGRVWPPLNWLCLEGLRRHDSDAAALLLRRSRELARWELTHHGHVHENLSALTGQGEPRPGTYARSCPLYAWGGLMWVP